MSNLTLSNDEENTEEDSAIVPSTKRTQFLATYCHQRFPFRASVMLYVAENPTLPKTYLKMIETCKFFFVQNSVLIFCDLYFNGIEWKQISNLHREHFVDLEKIMTKFWIINNFGVSAQKDGDQNIIPSLIPKFFRMDATDLFIENQVFSFDDYVYLTSSSEKIHLSNVTVENENGSVLPVEKLVETATNAKSFVYVFDTVLSNITSETFGELLKLPHFLQLDIFYLKHIPETFDIEAFYNYMKQNMRTFFFLEFDATISEVYKNRLEQIIDEILAAKTCEYRNPFIYFSDLHLFKMHTLLRMSQNR